MARHEVRPVDLEMRVKTLCDQGRTRLYYTLHSPTGVVAFAHKEMVGPEFPGSSEELQARLFKKIERLGKLEDFDGTPLTKSERDRKLESLGQDLWRDLLPSDFRLAYREIRNAVRTWTIISDEPWIPWELVKPYDSSDPDRILDDEFVTLQFELTRWLAGDKTPAFHISIEHFAAIEASTNLPLSFAERETLTEIFTANLDMKDVTPTGRSAAEMLEFLRTEAADLIHFIGHGIQIANLPEESGIEFQDGSILRVGDFSGAIATRISRLRPFIFLNACSAGRQGRALTRLGGWATRLVGICGCGAFVAPMWPVRDSTAATFSQSFYRSLQEGATLGEAALFARRHAFRMSGNDPSALAYAIYGHPNAQVQFGARVTHGEAESLEKPSNISNGSGAIVSQHRGGRKRTALPRASAHWIAVASLALATLLGALELGRRSVSEGSPDIKAEEIRQTSDLSVPSEKPTENPKPAKATALPPPATSKTPTSTPNAPAIGEFNRFELKAAQGVPKSLTRSLSKAAVSLAKAGLSGWTIHISVESPEIVPHEQDGLPWVLCRLVATGKADRHGLILDLGTVIAVNSQVDSSTACEACAGTLAQSIVKRF